MPCATAHPTHILLPPSQAALTSAGISLQAARVSPAAVTNAVQKAWGVPPTLVCVQRCVHSCRHAAVDGCFKTESRGVPAANTPAGRCMCIRCESPFAGPLLPLAVCSLRCAPASTLHCASSSAQPPTSARPPTNSNCLPAGAARCARFECAWQHDAFDFAAAHICSLRRQLPAPAVPKWQPPAHGTLTQTPPQAQAQTTAPPAQRHAPERALCCSLGCWPLGRWWPCDALEAYLGQQTV